MERFIKNICMVCKINIFIFLLIISAVTYANHKQGPLKSKPSPNILLINIDDLGWRDLGFIGSQYYETPNIEPPGC